MDKFSQKSQVLVCYVDDVLITAENDEEHLHRLELVHAQGEWSHNQDE